MDAPLPEIYVSTDIEADGPIPGPNSMLSVGAAAYRGDGTLVGTFTVNLATLAGASGDPDTMEWWAKKPEAWAACREDPRPPEEAMHAFAAWLEALPGRPIFVAYPATFDFMFVVWYLERFAGRNPFSFSGLDVKTLAMALMRCDFSDAVKRNMPKRWFGEPRTKHIALDDAIAQGELFCNMLREWREGPRLASS
jgi:hypothetical protein